MVCASRPGEGEQVIWQFLPTHFLRKCVRPRSNYGAKSVQLAAPGTGILATSPYDYYAGQLYQLDTGTSMAAPFVSGAAALALAASGGTLTNAQVCLGG